MAEVITMPRLSDTMTEGKVAKWHKKVGDTVNEGDILAEIETDKAVQDFESEIKGTLLYIGVEEGNGAPVDSVLAIIGEQGEDISALKEGDNSDDKKDNEIPEDFKTEKENTAVETSEPVEKETDHEETSATEIPEGVEVVTMPRLSDTMTEGKVAKWHKNVGDTVKEGDILAEIETDKAVQDFEAETTGTLLHQGVAEGEAAPVDSVLAIIGPEGTDVSGVLSGGKKKEETKKEPQQKAEETEKSETVQQQDSTLPGDRIAISPLAKKMAKEKGIDITSIQGSGENGRIVRKDIENYQPSTKSAFSETAAASPKAAQPAMNFVQGEDSETPNSQIRTIIAKRLSESKFTAPHYYLIIEVNMDKAIQARKEINSLPDTRISFNDMIIKATAMALRKHPQVNSSWKEDRIVHHGNINVGVAVAVPDGLVVPVLKNTDQMNYTQISAAVKDMAGRAKSKGLKANEMEGSTFSVSNLGMYGIDTFTSIINQPNSAILSVGAIVEKPIVKDGQIVVGNTMKLSMACDHRVVDGATGAEFLQTLRTYLEQPLTLLL